jgi:hypothetical protein
MPQKRNEVVEKAAQTVPDIYEAWLKKQVAARHDAFSEDPDDAEEDEIDKAEDLHEKAHRRKRGRGAAANSA